jgi:hypothetical protein
MARGGLAQREAAFARELNAQQFQDQRLQNDAYGDLSDSSDLSATQKSPLELPQRSYTNAGEEDEEGLPSTMMELERQRTKEAKMREAAEQFVGAPVVPTVGPQEGEPEGEETSETETTEQEESQEEAAPEIEEQEAQEEAYQRAIESARARRAQQKAAAEAAAGAFGADEAQELAVKSAWDGMKTGSSETIIGPILIQDIQLVNQIAFKSKGIPELRFIEIVELVFLHIAIALGLLIFLGFVYSLLTAAIKGAESVLGPVL